MLLQSFLSEANVHPATRTPIPTELLNNWQKCIGRKGAKSTVTLYTSPSPINDSDSDLPPLPITPLFTYTTRSSVAALTGEDANNVAGPSTIPQSQRNGTPETTSNGHAYGVDVIEIEGTSFHRAQ